MKKAISFLLLQLPLLVFSQVPQKVFTQDVDNFWIAYDSINSTNDKEQKLKFINSLYIDKASEGLKAFLKNKENPGRKWIDLISSDKVFWDNVRMKTLLVKSEITTIQDRLNFLQVLYPALKEAASYFIIGFRQQGGTVRNNISIIGSEVIASQPDFNATDLKRIFIHEYIHTQQVKPDFRNINVLTSSVREGACDFVTELVLQENIVTPYIVYGLKNEVKTWEVFKQDMLTNTNDLWVSTGNNPGLPIKDAGYFVGYAICKSYFRSSKDKGQAVKDIIELDYTNPEVVLAFLTRSNYERSLIAKGYDPLKKLPVEGYAKRNSRITFQFSAFDKLVIAGENRGPTTYDPKKMGEITTVSVAGEFNNWNSNHAAFQMAKARSGKFTLTVDSHTLGKPGQQIKFRFVINKKYWVQPKFAISNRVTDKDGTSSLYIGL